ncbi:MAG: hypothetical protein OK454_10555 [Thaumarchaeota archaeon]|nr:hypothetical protein [Nitrososphaerota archaeon]
MQLSVLLLLLPTRLLLRQSVAGFGGGPSRCDVVIPTSAHCWTIKYEKLWGGPVSAGYSGKPLAQKLGIKKGDVLVFSNAPDGYDRLLGRLPDGAIVARELEGPLDFVQLFSTERSSLEKELRRLKARLKPDGMIWVSWLKASSRRQTDLSDRVVREVGLKSGLVDVKVCAIDDSWSALKFVRRLKDRDDNLRPRDGEA